MIISTKKKVRNLVKLYEQIHSCARCPIDEEISKVIRIIDEQVLTSKIFLVGQALGGSTQRLSGRPYIKVDGRPSNTGQRLNKFINLFGYTIDSLDISDSFKYIYSSDIVQCYPGKDKSGHGDRKPNDKEILKCINQGFLLKEIELISPKLLFLMGKASRDCFYKFILHEPCPDSLSEHISEIAKKEQIPHFNLFNRDIFILPIQHPSGANPNFRQMLHNYKLIELTKEIIE